MNMRESFEKRYPVPDWVQFDIDTGAYYATPDFIKDSIYFRIYCERWNGYKQGWIASRAAIVLPESTGGYIAGEYGNGYADALHEVKQAIGVDVP